MSIIMYGIDIVLSIIPKKKLPTRQNQPQEMNEVFVVGTIAALFLTLLFMVGQDVGLRLVSGLTASALHVLLHPNGIKKKLLPRETEKPVWLHQACKLGSRGRQGRHTTPKQPGEIKRKDLTSSNS